VQEKTEEVKEAAVKAAKPVVQVVAPAIEREEPKAASSLSRLAQPPSAPESTTDGDSLAGYDEDEDDESDEDETEEASAQTSPKTATPRAASPAPAAAAEGDKPKETYTGADHDPKKKLQAIITRTVWGFVLAGGAIGLVLMGHVYVIALIFVIQAMVFKELTNLFDVGYSGAHVTEEGKMTRTPEKEAKRRGRKEQRERWSRQMAWCVLNLRFRRAQADTFSRAGTSSP
jgi:phosphatidate cytidylyltransferase